MLKKNCVKNVIHCNCFANADGRKEVKCARAWGLVTDATVGGEGAGCGSAWGRGGWREGVSKRGGVALVTSVTLGGGGVASLRRVGASVGDGR